MKKLLTLFLLVLSFNSFSFDTKTHVYVSQQVLNDLEDGSLDIGPFKNIPVDASVKNAILSNKRIYRMGNVGPDGFPDLISGQQTTHPGIEGGWNTDDWLRHIRSAGDSGSAEMKAFAYGYLGHAAADTFAHTYVNWYAGDAFSLGNGVEEEIRHTLVEKFIAKHQPKLRDNSGQYIGEPQDVIALAGELPIASLVNNLILNDEVASQYDKVALTVYLSNAKKLYDALENTENELKKLDAYDWTGIYGQIESKVMLLYKEQAILPYYVTRDVTERVCKKVRVWKKLGTVLNPFWGWGTKKVCDIVEKTIQIVNPAVQEIDDQIDELISKKEEIQSLNYWVKRAINNWRSGINIALKEYVKTSSLIAQDAMTGGDILRRFNDWFSCYGLIFVGMPSQVNQGVCYTGNKIDELLENLSKAERLALVLVPHQYGPVKIYKDIKKKFNDEVKHYLREYAEEEFGKDIFILVDALKGNVTDESINLAFTRFSGGTKGLLPIPNVSQRIKADMGIGNDSVFNKESFNVVYNAINLSKLSLLNHNGINDLISKAGSNVYAGNWDQNILEGFLKSIDGNHQWFDLSPGYPRVEAKLELGKSLHRDFGYSKPDGFLFWRNEDLRTKVFKKVFKGPIAPGLEDPVSVGLKRILPYKFDYNTCKAIPYPNDIENHACKIIPVLPSLMMIIQN